MRRLYYLPLAVLTVLRFVGGIGCVLIPLYEFALDLVDGARDWLHGRAKGGA